MFNLNLLLLFHVAGIIIGLGATTVIDTLGFISRKSKKWTETTIEAHYVTKPLIWAGIFLLVVTWILMLFFQNPIFPVLKSVIIFILLINGAFLSFYISPNLGKLRRKNKLLPKSLQFKITLSLIVSFVGWWSAVILTVAGLG